MLSMVHRSLFFFLRKSLDRPYERETSGLRAFSSSPPTFGDTVYINSCCVSVSEIDADGSDDKESMYILTILFLVPAMWKRPTKVL